MAQEFLDSIDQEQTVMKHGAGNDEAKLDGDGSSKAGLADELFALAWHACMHKNTL